MARVKTAAGGQKKSKRSNDGDVDNQDAKKKKKQVVEVPDVLDVFDRDVLVDIKTDICAMCKGNHEVGLRLKEKIIVRQEEDEEIEDAVKLYDPNSILDVNGVWASKYSIPRKSQRLFVHYYCGLNSPLASFNGKEWHNLAKEVFRSRTLKCRYCGLSGASLGCLDSRCHVVMHVPCAVKLGFRRCGFKVSYLCEDHLKANQDKELELDKAVSGDLSRGLEPTPVTFSNTLDDADARLAIEYTKKNLDSADVVVNLNSIHNMACCNCEGLCDDVTKCACLAQGRNYTFTGGLIPGAKKRLLECNLRCSCSIRRCSNRVVERGITARLEVFRVPQELPTDGSMSILEAVNANTWGVRTLDFIPKGGFVCEVTGQYVLGKTKDAVQAQNGTVADAIIKGSDNASSSHRNGSSSSNSSSSSRRRGAYSTNVTPVATWEEGVLATTTAEAVLDPALWAAQQAAEKALGTGLEDEVLQQRAQARQVEAILTENEDLVRQFLDGQLCIDSRRFGNVGSFIRRRPARPNKPSNMFTIDDVSGLVSNSSSDTKKIDKMLDKRLVFTNFRADGSGPKLALFAARSIDANTELFL